MFWQAADGTGEVERLTRSANSQQSLAMAPDGRTLLFRENRDTTRNDILAMPLSGTEGGTPLLQTSFSERTVEVSPDGRWIAYESDESGRLEVYVRPFPDTTAGRWQVSTVGGRMPLWARNGNELFFLAPDGAIMALQVEASGGVWRSTVPTQAVSAKYFHPLNLSGRTYDVSPDGRRFLMIESAAGRDDARATQIVLVQHWFEELKRLVPTD